MRSSLLRRLSLPLVAGSVAIVASVASCGGNPEITGNADGGGSGGGGNGTSPNGGGGTGGLSIFVGGGGTGGMGVGGDTVGPVCGDGNVDPGEACDDANIDSGDGCSGTCDAIETDWACPIPGMPCVFTVVCGDSKISGAENCDDGNASPGDGCDSTCMVEPGWVCLKVGAQCEAAMCGDGIIAGDEECEDDDMPPADGDGCSAICQLEPGFKCDIPGSPCEPTVCGDGIVEGSEQCDDANNDLGDGCTPFCINEPDCTNGPCTSSCGDGIKLPNGTEQCEDGNTDPGDGCDANCMEEPGYDCVDNATIPSTLVLPIVLRDFMQSHPDMEFNIATDKNIVTTTLGVDGKPVYANPGGTTPTTTGEMAFNQWYRDVAGVNQTLLQTIALGLTNINGVDVYQFSDTTFFPLNGLGFGNEGNSQNFHFTSEVRYWFEYKGGETLSFTGDDDVWVFINKQRVIDLGGVHGAQSDSVTLDAAAAATLGLNIGDIYEIVVFQAERHTSQSNYTLTLGNFINAISTCTPVCGDGVKTPDEACDDGVNDGSYGSCNPDCTKGPFCGDGVLQDMFEECDDGVNLTPYEGCAPGCVEGAFCGDGNTDSVFGEQCDDGINDGGYNECASGCVLGERCGDGIVQSMFEECDDGNTKNGDGCDADCTFNGPN